MCTFQHTLNIERSPLNIQGRNYVTVWQTCWRVGAPLGHRAPQPDPQTAVASDRYWSTPYLTLTSRCWSKPTSRKGWAALNPFLDSMIFLGWRLPGHFAGVPPRPALGGCLGHPPPGAQPFAEHYSQFDSTIRPIGLTRAVVRSAFIDSDHRNCQTDRI
jgi:hypothetical protein